MTLGKCSGELFLVYFSGKGGFFSCGSWSGFVLLRAEGRPVELVTWPTMSWVGQTEDPNLVSCCFLLQRYSGELLLGDFLVTWGCGKVSRLRFVGGYERSTIVVAACLEVACFGRTVAEKMLARLYTISGQPLLS